MGIQINGQTDTVTATDGSINVGGDVTIPGVLTYEDVTNVDSVGIVTAQSGIHVTSGQVLVAKTTTSITTQGSRVDNGLITVSGNSNSTNLAVNAGGALSLANIDSTDNNFSNIGGYNSNGLVVSQIDFINKSHSSRTGDIAFLTHNGSVMSESLRITSDGKVAIGFNAPAVAGLSISNSSTNRGLEFDTGSGFDSTSCIRAYDRPTTAYKSLGLTGSDIKFGINDVEKVCITSAGNLGVGVTNPTQKLMVKGIIASEATNSTNNWMAYTYTDNTFRLNYKGAGADEVVITSGGAFGIGANNPDTLLHVKSSDNVLAKFESTDADALIEFKDNSTTDTILMGALGGDDLLLRCDAGSIKFYLENNTEKFRITNDGKTGIGGITPQNLLNVNATGSMGLYGTTTGKVGHSIRFIRKYGSSATHNFAVVNGASPHGQSRLGGFVATYTFRSAYGFDSDGGGHGVRMLSGRVRDSGEWGFDTETNYGTGDSPRPTLQGVDNSDGTCTLQVVNPGSTHSYGEFHIVAWDCQITTPTT